jgi:hypothetical protein
LTADRNERLPGDPKSSLKGHPPGRSGRVARFVQETLKRAATLIILAFAVLAAQVIWDSYVTAPWTRDGNVRVQVASVAPQVSGQIRKSESSTINTFTRATCFTSSIPSIFRLRSTRTTRSCARKPPIWS